MKQNHKIVRWIVILLAIGLCVTWWIFTHFTDSQDQHAITSITAVKVTEPISSDTSSHTSTTSLSSNSSSSKSKALKGMDICGIGHVDIDPNDDKTVNNYLENLSKDVWRDWKKALLNSDVYATRAMGILLNGYEKKGSTKQFDSNSLQDLVELAVDSRDPMAYSIAYQVCNKKYFGNAIRNECTAISPEGWAAVDPDNAVPLLLVAEQREKIGNLSGASEALKEASEASRINSYREALLSNANSLKPTDISPIVLTQLETRLYGYEAAWPMDYLGAINQFCIRDNSITPLNIRKDSCNKLAELMVNRSTSIIELAVGRKLGERAGWPKDRIDKLKQLQAAMLSASSPPLPTSLDCKSFEKINNYFLLRAKLGERGAAEFYIEHSGKNIYELAQH